MLSLEQRKQVRNALIDAFPDRSSLEQLLYFELKKSLNEITKDSSLDRTVFELIRTAEAQGWLPKLVRSAYDSNPGNSQLQAIVQDPSLLDTPQESNIQEQKILILDALPEGLRLYKEIWEIEEAIKREVKQDSFNIKIKTTKRPQDIRRAIAEERPSVVHLCGHGIEDGSLILEDDRGQQKPVLPTALASLFQQHRDYVKCVLLNARYSSELAKVISQHINYVIGMHQPIDDRAAIVFAKGFYDGLRYYNNIDNQDIIRKAWDEGRVAIELENLLQNSSLVLWGNGILQKTLEQIENLVSNACHNSHEKSFVSKERSENGTNSNVKEEILVQPSRLQKPEITSKQEKIKTDSLQISRPTTKQKTPLAQTFSEKNLISYIQKLPKGKEYPVYEVFGVICLFECYAIPMFPEILPLCLPQYSKQAVQKVLDSGLNNELKDLAFLSIQGKLKQIKIRDKNINIQKVLQIYTGKSLEEYCTTVIATIDISLGSHQSWISYCLRSLVRKGEDNTVFKILQNYQQKIQDIKSEEGVVWIEIYEALRKKCPEDETIRRKYLQTILSYGTNEQKYNLIDETKPWLLKNSENIVVRHLYLKLVFQSGNQQQQQDAIAQTTIWLKENSSKFKRILSQEQTVKRELIQLLQSFINFAIACSPQTQENYQILFTIFDLFREYLSKSYYDKLTNLIAESSLNISIDYWKQMVNATNILRDYHNDLVKAEQIYLKILNACKTQLKKSSINSQDVNKINNIMQYTQLHYSRLLIQRKPPKTDEAIGYLKELINETPKHGLANLYIAQSYQLKGDTFFRKAREHYQRAINLDIEKTGYFWYEFGRFYLYSIKNVSRAFTCFQESLKQKKNLGACVELADLEVRNQNFSKAKQLLQEGRSLERMTHRDKKQWLDLQPRIKEIESRISKKLDK